MSTKNKFYWNNIELNKTNFSFTNTGTTIVPIETGKKAIITALIIINESENNNYWQEIALRENASLIYIYGNNSAGITLNARGDKIVFPFNNNFPWFETTINNGIIIDAHNGSGPTITGECIYYYK